MGITAEAAAPDAPVSPDVPPADPSAATGAATGSGAVAKALGVGAAIVALACGAWLLTRPDPVTEAAPSASAPAVEEPPMARPDPPSARTAPSVSAPQPAESPGKPPVSEPSRVHASGPSESALLAQAQAALSSNPSRALALTREHKRRFPKGALVQEREVIAIEALNRIGDTESARKRAKSFEDSYPGSAHRRKVQNATKP